MFMARHLRVDARYFLPYHEFITIDVDYYSENVVPDLMLPKRKEPLRTSTGPERRFIRLASDLIRYTAQPLGQPGIPSPKPIGS
jgi:hypothetical protein